MSLMSLSRARVRTKTPGLLLGKSGVQKIKARGRGRGLIFASCQKPFPFVRSYTASRSVSTFLMRNCTAQP